MRNFLSELKWRGLIQDATPGLEARLAKGPISAYVGFDPTAVSLQVGNLVPIMLLAHLQRAGGTPIVVLGGGTGRIGDPSGKRAERPLLDLEQIAANVDRQRAQFERFLDFDGAHGARMVDNAEWLAGLGLVDFLRDVGKHFTISYMMQKESVRTRLEAGISYTEFSYMLLQAYDFLQLFRTHRCEMQMGGSDQWGNITAGIELIRRVEGGDAHGLSAPLITTSTGAKFGKSEGENIWLDSSLTSPYRFHQFWINSDDRDVESHLGMFTFRPREEIAALMDGHRRNQPARIPHRALATGLTERVHGTDAARRAEEASGIMFGEGDPAAASAETWKMLATEIPSAPLPGEFTRDTLVADLAVMSGIVKSKAEARRQIEQGGLSLNGNRVSDAKALAGEPLAGGYYWLSRGRKTHAILTPPP